MTKAKLVISDENIITVQDWDDVVQQTYGKPYNFQQQGGCQSRGVYWLDIPGEDIEAELPDTIPEVTNHETRGVNFKAWLARDPKQLIKDDTFSTELWWHRNFYPKIETVAKDLCDKGIIEEGRYMIQIDW